MRKLTRLSKRLQRLEEEHPAYNPWSANFGAAQGIALRQLSPNERDLVTEIYRRCRGPSSAEEDEAWARWEAALEQAQKEIGYPVRFGAWDWGELYLTLLEDSAERADPSSRRCV